MNIKKNRISFFENVYYWLWYYLSKVTPKSGASPEIYACTIVTAFKIVNIFFIVTILSILFKDNIIKALVQSDNRTEVMFIAIPIALILIYIDERLYQRRHEVIADKYANVSQKDKKKKRLIFLCYVIFSIACGILFPELSMKYGLS